MIGLIKKDLLVLKSNLKVAIAVIVALIFFKLQGNSQSSIFILPIIGIMLFIGTFSYDDFNHWNSYAASLPNGRKNVIKSKYIASITLLIVLSVISFIVTLIGEKVGNNSSNINEISLNFIGTILCTTLLIALLYPFMIKYGAINGRIIIFVFIMGIGAVGYIVSKFIDVTYIMNFIDSLENIEYIGVPILSAIILSISYFISSKIYQNKEF